MGNGGLFDPDEKIALTPRPVLQKDTAEMEDLAQDYIPR
jgi:hypothetical protein